MAAEQPPYGSENRTVICTVVFVDLVDYSRRPVAQQVVLKRHLNEVIGRALAQVAESDRLALDTGDGAALCFFGDPEDALFAAASLRDAIKLDPGPGGAQVRVGINLGPTRLVRDVNGNRNIIGDGINVAQRVMGFAAPNQVLVSRSFYEVVSHISNEYAQLFHYAGLHRDKHVREHELYEVHGGAGAPAASTEDAAQPVTHGPAVFSPELLARVARALTDHLGPVAAVVVRRASQHARDARQLLAAAADSLSGPAREAFLATMADVAAPRPPAAAAAPPEPPPPVAPARTGLGATVPPEPLRRATGPITPAFRAAAEERLARHVGPIARVLVARAAREASDAGRLADRLATHIEDPGAREAFLAGLADVR